MLQILAALVGTSITAAAPINPSNWVTSRDYPYARTAPKQGVTRFQLIISSEGKIEQCQILNSSGFDDLDSLTCALMIERGQFRPARDQNGVAIWSIFRSQVVWQAPGHSLAIQPWDADLTLQVNRLPPKVSDPVRLHLHVVVAGDRHIEACNPKVEKGTEALGEIACQQIMDGWKPNGVNGADGVSQRSLQSIDVNFTTSGE